MPTKIFQTTESLLSEISLGCPEAYSGKEGFMFQAFQCVMFETAVNYNRYEYAAYNITSGEYAVIDIRRTPLRHTEGDTVEILKKLRKSHISGMGRIEIDSDAPLRVQKVREVMYEIFCEILPQYGYVVREGQLELAEKLLDTIAGRSTLLAESAVGIGKTLAYIIIAILVKRSRLNEDWNTAYYPDISVVEWKRMPIAISTASIALQRAILKDVVPEISKILMENGVINKPINAVLAKGKSHYVCEHNLRAHLPFEKKTEIAGILRQIAFDGQRTDLAEIENLTAHVKRKICVPRKCHKKCPFADECRYRAYRASMMSDNIDLLITNHNLLLADAKLRTETGRSVLPPFQMAVYDEAHELLKAGRSIYGSALDKNTVPNIAQAVLKLNFAPLHMQDTEDWRDVRNIAHRLAEKLHGQSKRLFAKREAGQECDHHMKRIGNILSELHYVLKKAYTLKNKLDEKCRNGLLLELEQLRNLIAPMASSYDNIRWFESNESANTSLCSLPKALNEIIFADLWSRGIPSMLTSGTLSVSGDFGAVKQSLGLSNVSRISETVQPSPYDYSRNCILYIPENMPFPNQSSKTYISALTDEIERLIRTSNGHSAVLFTSYYVLEKVHYELDKRGIPCPLFKLERSTSNAIERFKESGNGVLLASGALWQGIDIPGDLLSLLIIAKLPFPQPDAISDYERTLYSSFRAYRDSVIIPLMLILLKQGFGRLIRSETDTGIVAILDCRAYYGKPYHECVVEALPKCRITACIDVVGDYLHTVKPDEFFEKTETAL